MSAAPINLVCKRAGYVEFHRLGYRTVSFTWAQLRMVIAALLLAGVEVPPVFERAARMVRGIE